MYKIIVDSSADMTPEIKKKLAPTIIPYKLYIGEREYVDAEGFDADGFVRDFTASKHAPKSACPAPAEYLEALVGADEYFIVCLSGKLSGAHNSALIAKRMFEEEGRHGRVEVIDSKSAASGETLVVSTIHELKERGFGFDETVAEIRKFVDNMGTYFVLESFSNLIKNGRMPMWKGFLATTLQITPIMTSDNGNIKVLEKIRNIEKVYRRLIEILKENLEKTKKASVYISYVTTSQRALQIKQELENAYKQVEVFVSKCAGLSSMYADKNGIVISL